MENNYFILSPQHNEIKIERFHLCTWEMKDETALIEFGMEIAPITILPKQLEIELHIPWLNDTHKVNDLYNKLKEESNCRFIFNDNIDQSKFIKEGNRDLGTIQHLTDHGALCLIPIEHSIVIDKHLIKIIIDTEPLKKRNQEQMHLYLRFYLEPNISLLTTRTRGITKTSLIYDVKINEKRNLPTYLLSKNLCNIDTCFLFHMIPNDYELIFIDNKTCKSIRSLEFDSFQKYLPNKGFKKDELIVIFNKKDNSKSFTFFSTYAKERISPSQILLTIFINLFCGLILFLSPIRTCSGLSYLNITLWKNVPAEAYICITIILISLLYFLGPSIYRFICQTWKRFFWRFKGKR